jgi:hypothetical protein
VTDGRKTLSGIQSVYIENQQAIVENNKITKYRVNAKWRFLSNSP